MPKVTVLMPAYNAALYIEEAIASVLRQSMPDFEFLIIDDGSTDKTPDIIKSFDDPRIRVISRPNKGLIESLNEGLLAAKAPLIARFDADDICHPQRLEVQCRFLAEHPDYVLVGSDVHYMDKDGQYLLTLNPAGHSYEEIMENIYRKCPFLHSAVTFYKETILAAGGYSKGALTFEDHLLWVKVLQTGKACNLSEVLVDVRLNPESATIDERWRGKEFISLRDRSLRQGYVTDEDAQQLKEIISVQNASAYKKASYYAMVGKKYLWDNPSPAKARKQFAAAIKHYPKNKEPYLLWLLSWMPSAWVQKLYRFVKPKKV